MLMLQGVPRRHRGAPFWLLATGGWLLVDPRGDKHARMINQQTAARSQEPSNGVL
jgi:hypothetical protein